MKIAMTLGRVGCALLAAGLMTELSAAPFVSRADSPPRKIVVASALANFSGSVEARLELAGKLIDAAAQEAAAKYPGGRFDLMVLPEFAILRETGITAKERAVSLEGVVGETLGAKAREHRAWFIVPMTLREAEGRISNAAVLFGRDGKVAGIFRKVHPMLDADGATFEGGVTPGGAYPVFECDFGRLGILICWDMSYEDAWAALAAKGAELVALPSASPQTLRPAAAALRHHYYVVNSAPRDNASVFDPIGRTIAQVTEPGVVVQQVDLAYAILHWSEGLKNGTALAERFGERAGGDYSSREDTGVFWSNDPNQSVGEMVRELGLKEMPQVIEEVGAAAERRL
jgi:predicted amidohydrolase